MSNILEILDRMFSECSIRKDTTERIRPRSQDAVIQAYSHQYIGKIKGIPEHGDELFSIVDAFGSMSGRLLREYPWLERDETRRDPYRLIRIELDEGLAQSARKEMTDLAPDGQDVIDSMDRATRLLMLLQRHCIFIDAEESRSRRNTLASKMILRRIFCPAFRTTLVNSESFTLDRSKWDEFCNDPKGFADRYVRAVVTTAKKKRGMDQPDQLSLFQGQGGDGR